MISVQRPGASRLSLSTQCYFWLLDNGVHGGGRGSGLWDHAFLHLSLESLFLDQRPALHLPDLSNFPWPSPTDLNSCNLKYPLPVARCIC